MDTMNFTVKKDDTITSKLMSLDKTKEKTAVNAVTNQQENSKTMNDIQLPQFFCFKRAEVEYLPLLKEALNQLRKMSIAENLYPFLAYQVWENPQPSYMVLPFMFLASAEATGGINEQHIEYLPIVMLIAELMAVSDDTVDRTPFRSDRPSFPAHFGDASALPFATSLTTTTLSYSRFNEKLFDALAKYYLEFYRLELWERRNIFPDLAIFDTWLKNRYLQTIVVTEFMFNAGSIINNYSLWPRSAIDALSRIEQDVDDIVNLVEYREALGENDDLLVGVVSRPLIIAISEYPALADNVSELWNYYRPLYVSEPSIRELQESRKKLFNKTMPLYKSIRDKIIELGVPKTAKMALQDFRTSVQSAPLALRPFMREVSETFIRRLRRCQYVNISESELIL